MDRRDRKRDSTVIRGSTVGFTRARTNAEMRDISPADGSIARSGSNVSVFCAPCQRWIDCLADIEPHVALERHGSLVHAR